MQAELHQRNMQIDYLTNRTQHIIVSGVSSESSSMISSVPQGSVLGPLLFIIYNKDLLGMELTVVAIWSPHSKSL